MTISHDTHMTQGWRWAHSTRGAVLHIHAYQPCSRPCCPQLSVGGQRGAWVQTSPKAHLNQAKLPEGAIQAVYAVPSRGQGGSMTIWCVRRPANAHLEAQHSAGAHFYIWNKNVPSEARAPQKPCVGTRQCMRVASFLPGYTMNSARSMLPARGPVHRLALGIFGYGSVRRTSQ